MKLSKEYKSQLKDWYLKDKLSTYKIGKILNKHPSTVRKHLINLGLKLRANIKPELINKEFLIKNYIQEKKSTHQIGRDIECSNHTISKYLKIYGIPSRKFSGETDRKSVV